LNSNTHKNNILNLDWKVGFTELKNIKPQDFFPAKIPGAVQHDYIIAKNIPPFEFNNNIAIFKEFEDKYWIYQTSFSKPQILENQNLVFKSAGIDYEFDIIINGTTIHYQEGMFTPVYLVLNDYLQAENILEVIIYPIPKKEGEIEGRSQARFSTKPPVPYGWDWHPRLVPVGIWDETFITIQPKQAIISSELEYELTNNLQELNASVKFEIKEFALNNYSYKWELLSQNGNSIANSTNTISSTKTIFDFSIKNPELWWPHDHGSAYLYTSKITILDKEQNNVFTENKKVGFRKVELVMNANAWIEPVRFPKSRSTAPFTLMVNNTFIFAKGSNWVHPEIFYGNITEELYKEQLDFVKECNMNILRIWGGGITNKQIFHNLCDEMGILVWQEFPLACNNYPDDKKYLAILEQEARSIIANVKGHPSLCMWSGGNELFNNWSGMTEQSHALRLLNSLCYELDRNTPFIYTSPLYGVAHGHYLFYDNDTNEDVFELMHGASNTAYTEFGMPSLAPIEVLKQIIPKEELFPIEPTLAWKVHNAFEAWQESSWLEIKTLEKYFGIAESLEDIVWQSQMLQSIGYKAIFEEGRRQKPECSMVLNWCFNEPWQNAANNNLIVYPNIKKPAFYAVKESLRPVCTSAAFEKFSWNTNDFLHFDLWMLNDTYKTIKAGTIKAFITINKIKEYVGEWNYSELLENTNSHGPTLRFKIPEETNTQLVKINIEHIYNSEYNSEYFILIKNHKKDIKSNIMNNALNY